MRGVFEMLQFLKALEQKKEDIYKDEYGDINASTESFFQQMCKKYKALEGKRMQYIDKSTRTNVVVTVKRAYPHYVMLERTYYGFDELQTGVISVPYGSLYCGDAVLKEEDIHGGN